MTYQQYRRKQLRRKFWRSTGEAILLLLGVATCFAFMLAPLVFQFVAGGR